MVSLQEVCKYVSRIRKAEVIYIQQRGTVFAVNANR